VHGTSAETTAVSRGTSHVKTKQRCDHFDGYSEGKKKVCRKKSKAQKDVNFGVILKTLDHNKTLVQRGGKKPLHSR